MAVVPLTRRDARDAVAEFVVSYFGLWANTYTREGKQVIDPTQSAFEFYAEGLPDAQLLELSKTKTLFAVRRIPEDTLVPAFKHLSDHPVLQQLRPPLVRLVASYLVHCTFHLAVRRHRTVDADGSMVDAGLQLLVDLGIDDDAASQCCVECIPVPPDVTVRFFQLAQDDPVTVDNQCWLIRPVAGALVPLPFMMMLYDWFGEAHIARWIPIVSEGAESSRPTAPLVSWPPRYCPFEAHHRSARGLRALAKLALGWGNRAAKRVWDQLCAPSVDLPRLQVMVQRFARGFSGRRPFRVVHGHRRQPRELEGYLRGWQSTFGIRSWRGNGFTLPVCPGNALLATFGICPIRHRWTMTNDTGGTHEDFPGRDNVPVWAMVALREGLHRIGVQTVAYDDPDGFWNVSSAQQDDCGQRSPL